VVEELLEELGAGVVYETSLASTVVALVPVEGLETAWTALAAWVGAWVEPIVAAEASVGMAMPVMAAALRVTVRTCLRAGADRDRRLNDKIQTLPLQAAYRVS
jgi:hypothetical protein